MRIPFWLELEKTGESENDLNYDIRIRWWYPATWYMAMKAIFKVIKRRTQGGEDDEHEDFL